MHMIADPDALLATHHPDEDPEFQMGVTNRSREFKALNPNMKVPTLVIENEDGTTDSLFEVSFMGGRFVHLDTTTAVCVRAPVCDCLRGEAAV